MNGWVGRRTGGRTDGQTDRQCFGLFDWLLLKLLAFNKMEKLKIRFTNKPAANTLGTKWT